ncbi:DUF3089 domain-containing protein [Phenylobacterium sp. LjRoot219]|uniref:DUF3089 domain-containing protein n=1 Tax=Phenylobacterium sp. LjRoot219 TaxID=3342283 RepID=UPI003F5090D1
MVLLVGVATGVFWDDLMKTALDPKAPFQTYRPPPAPDYAQRDAWALLPTDPARPGPGKPVADVFFIAPTTFDGGRHWNAPIGDARADRIFKRVMAPNYAGPFLSVGRLFSPRYREASLYSLLTLNEDARAARAFAYGDVERAFRVYLERYNQGRPIVIVGVEQGGVLAERLLAEVVASDPTVQQRLAVAYLAETAVPADAPPIPPCRVRGEPACLASWISVYEGQSQRARILLDRALVWGPGGELVNLDDRPALCFNPILGRVTNEAAPARLHLGAANATGLEWDARPGFLARQVSAQCQDGVLFVTRPKSKSLERQGNWAERRRVPGFNLFYADLEADAEARVAGLLARDASQPAAPASP